MRIGGFQKFSLIDYPGKIAAVIFTQGCNFRCSFCHNPELVIPDQYAAQVEQEGIFQFLKTRTGKLDGVVITGGEPTIYPDLLGFIQRIKEYPFSVKLDTNGSQPDILKKLIDAKLIDYIAMDLKAPLERYSEIVKLDFDVKEVHKSIDLIIASGINHEFRTTILNNIFSESDFQKIASLIKNARRYRLKTFVASGKIIDSSLTDCESYSKLEIENLQKKYGWGC